MLAYLYDCNIPAQIQVGMLNDCAAISLSTKAPEVPTPLVLIVGRPSSMPRPLSAAAVEGTGEVHMYLCPMMTSGSYLLSTADHCTRIPRWPFRNSLSIVSR